MNKIPTNEFIKNAQPKISIYEDISDFLSSNYVIFKCKKCAMLLFSNDDKYALLIEKNRFSIVIPAEVGANFSMCDKIKTSDDLIYYKAKCKHCEVILGKFVIGSNSRNKDLRNKLHIDCEGLSNILVKETGVEYIDLTKYIEFNNGIMDDLKLIQSNMENLLVNTNNSIIRNQNIIEELNVIKEVPKKLQEIIDFAKYNEIKKFEFPDKDKF